MHYLGYLIYVAVIAAVFAVPPVNEMIMMSLDVAPEITGACIVIAFYPITAFLYYHALGKKDRMSYERLCSISATSGNTVVSLGLIGTFVGLAQMIGLIAGAVGAKGGSVDEKIALIMTAIGESLSAMSFAFLTSIVGVGASVIVFCAAIYFKMFFDQSEPASDPLVSNAALEARIADLEADSNKVRHFISRIISSNIDRKELASIVISNTLQVKALREATEHLGVGLGSLRTLNEGAAETISAISVLLGSIDEAQKRIVQFEAGSYKILGELAEATGKIESNQRLQNSKAETTIGAIAKGLLSVNT